MAAKLKKRALAEYQSQVESEDNRSRVSKKLKLLLPAAGVNRTRSTSTSSSSTATRRFSTATVSEADEKLPGKVRDIGEIVVKAIPAIENGSMSAAAMADLAKRLNDEIDNNGFDEADGGESRRQIYLCLSAIVSAHGDAHVPLSADLCDVWLARLLQSGKANDEENRAAILALLADWLRSNRRTHQPTQARLLKATKCCLKSLCHRVKVTALMVLGNGMRELSSHDRSVAAETMPIIGRHTRDQDPRVRKAAFEALLNIHTNGNKLDSGTYTDLCLALTDDYEGVRLAGLQLIHTMAVSYPEETVGQDMRLIDDAFGRICNAVQDLSVPVRSLSVQLIGSLDGVSECFLEQTLDKKLMSNMRSKRSAHERQARLTSSGEWSSGTRWADDAPREQVDAASVSLMSLGACGAFIHGLEDEFLAVRSGAIESLTALSLKNEKLANMALDFLVDMFNDEIEAVRLKAIDSLTRISDRISLAAHQLETVLWALDDGSVVVREKLHEMLRASRIATKDGLQNVIGKLLENLKRYPQDRRSILATCKTLGSTHADLTLPLVTQLLEIHPFFDTPEPDIEDPAYVCVLVLVFNAAHFCPTLGTLLDEHTRRHYHYLEDTYPHLLPGNESRVDVESASRAESNTTQFVVRVMRNVHAACSTASLKMSARTKVLNRAGDDLERLGSIEPRLHEPAAFARNFIRCQSLVLRLLSARFWANKADNIDVAADIDALFKLCLQLEFRFKNVGPVHKRQIKMLRLQARALHLVYVVKASNKSALNATDCLMREIDGLDVDDDGEAGGGLLGEMAKLKGERKPGVIVRLLQPLLLRHPVEAVDFDAGIKMCRAVVYEPAGNNETPLRYIAGMILAVPVDADLQNVDDTSSLRIAIRTPDQKVMLVTPKASEVIRRSDGTKRLLANALMSHQNVWSEPLHVDISVALDIDSHSSLADGSAAYDSLIHLCDPVKVYVLPKAAKRGI